MSEKRRFYVTTEEAIDFWLCEATNARDAALIAMREWGLEADPGYKILVFDEDLAKVFPIELTVAA